MNVEVLAEALLAVFCITTLIQCFYLFDLSGLAFYKERVKPIATPPVTIIICARNESKNLRSFLPDVLNQD